MVTSSAVVGSSAISSLGSQASAIAIMARCRMPPDSSCGYCAAGPGPARASGPGSSASIARCGRRRLVPAVHAHRLGDLGRRWSSSGFSALAGSWKIMPMSLPRTCCMSALAQRASPCRPADTAPPVITPPGGSSRRTDSAVMVLPQPDSPTRPRHSPAATAGSRRPGRGRTVGPAAGSPSQAGDLEQRRHSVLYRRGGACSGRAGSRRRPSRSPSPSIVNATTTSTMARPGGTICHQ